MIEMKVKFSQMDARKLHDQLTALGVPVKGVTVEGTEVKIEVDDAITAGQKDKLTQKMNELKFFGVE